MDGVLVREEHALPGAAEFLQTLTERERPFLVLTNNSIFTSLWSTAVTPGINLHADSTVSAGSRTTVIILWWPKPRAASAPTGACVRTVTGPFG